MKQLSTDEAVNLLSRNEVVAIPTETVYGLAANAKNDDAVRKIFAAKGRPSDNPLIVHVGSIDAVAELVTEIPTVAEKLMQSFWPGPLTIILPSSGAISKLVTAGLDTVGLRMPNHPTALEILQKSGLPLAAPSANLSGKPSPTKAKHVVADLSNKIEGYVDGGNCDYGLESTVIDLTVQPPVILRPGGVSKKNIEAVIGEVYLSGETSDKPKAPGMKYAHYSPAADLFLVDGNSVFLDEIVTKSVASGETVGILCATPIDFGQNRNAVVYKTIGRNGNNLYAALREFDDEGCSIIFSEFFEDEAIMNRLLKASEERILSEVEN